MVTVAFVDELLEIVSCPDAEPTTVGLKVNVSEMACPGFSVAGKLTDDVENPLPVTAIDLIVTAEVPVDVSVTVCVVELFTTTEPKEMLLAFTLSAGVAAFNCSEVDFDEPPLLAVIVADCAVVTAATVAEKVADVAVAGTVTEPGTVTELLLLERAILTPPVGAEADSVTVHESDSAPVMDVLLHDSPLTLGVVVVPVPLRATYTAGALLEIDN